MDQKTNHPTSEPVETGLRDRLCAAFEQALQRGGIGPDSDFFALGGDTAKAYALLKNARIPGLTPGILFSGKTPRGVAALMEAGSDIVYEHTEKVPAVCPLGLAQRGVYLECVANPASTLYNIPFLCSLPEGTDEERFIAAVKTVAQAHPAFHVTFAAPEGVPSMLYRPGEIAVSVTEADECVKYCMETQKAFDLEKGPLYRFEIIRHSGGSSFLFDVHHLVFDGTSIELFLRQIAAVYNGEMTEIPPETLTCFDVARTEQGIRKTRAYREARDFFRDMLDGCDCDSKPVSDRLTEDGPVGMGRICLDDLGKDVAEGVARYTREHAVTKNTLFLGAFAYALAKFSGTQDSCFSTVSNGRRDPRLSGSVGMFVKMLPLHYAIDESTSVADFLDGVQTKFYAARSHDCIDFGEMAAEYGASTDVVFVYQADLLNGAELGSGRMDTISLEVSDPTCDLDVVIEKTVSGYLLLAHYRQSVYTHELVDSFVRLYAQVLRDMTRVKTLSEIRLTDEESEKKIEEINRTESPYDTEKTVVARFREQAMKTPDSVCLVCEGRRYTYRHVDEITDRLAKYLAENGLGREKVAGVLIPRSEYMLICSLGALKAGGAYLPLDPSYPDDRLNLMMRDSGAIILMSTPELEKRIEGDFTGLRLMTDDIPKLPDRATELPEPCKDDLFVMLYTSGSTGVPKGVMFEHSNALVTAMWVRKFYGMDGNTRVASYASYGFDAHVFDLYPPVLCGGQLHVIPEDMRLDFLRLRAYFNEEGITNAVMTTQVGRQFALLGGLTTLKHLSVAGEKLTPFDLPENFNVYNLYGPTEGSVVTSGFRIDRRYRDVPIGHAVDNLKLYVVDKTGRLLPTGATGELWISGPHVTRGYRNRPEKMAEAYGGNPFCAEEGYERVYRTGDVVRLLDDGCLQFIGRRDGQVKVRGFRVELTEIEEVVRRFPGIKDATVAAFDEPSGGKYVAAYVVSDETVDVEKLNAFIRAEKPPYMVPAVTMQIEKIPLNQNQKVNRRALPVPERKKTESVPPENETQKKIFDVIADVIGHDSFGVDTDIYDAGLTSIGAVKLNVALAEAFGVPIRIADIKANSTVRRLEGFLASAAPAERYEQASDYPITQTQYGLFVECMAAPDTTMYNIPVLMKLSPKVELPRLVGAVKAAIDAHSFVKTRLFTDGNGDVRAKRNDGAVVEIPIIRGELPDVKKLAKPFALLDEPLFRAAVYETPDGNYLYLDFHHIICDGTSEHILFRDISRAYAGEKLEKETFTGFEAALEEQTARSGSRYEAAKAYWKKLLTGCETECLPKKEPESAEGGANSRSLSATDAKAVVVFCEKNGLTMNAFFNAAFAFVMSRFAGKDSVTHTTVFNGRGDSRTARSVMMLARTVPVVCDLEQDRPVADYVRGVQEQLMSSMTHDACAFPELARDYAVKSDLILVYQGDDMRIDSVCGERAEMIDVPLNASKSPVSVSVYRTESCFDYVAEYRRDLYSAAFADGLLDALAETADAFTRCEKLSEVSMLSSRGEAVYAELNDSDTEIESRFVHELIEKSAAKDPEKTAVIAAGRKLTYGELNAQANRMAHALIKRGVKADDIVGVVLDRTVEVPVTELAIQKAGGAFLPMLPTYPDERVRYCLTDADSPFVITSEAIRQQKAELFGENQPYRALTVEELLEETATENPGIQADGGCLAYCIYTSGSTGTPKGVMVTRNNFTNMAQTNAMRLNYYTDPDADGAGLCCSSISFDMSLYEIYMPLCAGRTLCIATEEQIHDPLAMRELILENRVEMACWTPSFLNNLVTSLDFGEALSRMRTVVLGAEAFPSSMYDLLRRSAPRLQIVNGYGPTEASVCCSTKELTSGEGITIGRPTGNVKLYVTDRYGHELPPYAAGELVICGAGVGRGYVKLPDKTAASFFRLRGLPAYHSGDLVRLTGRAEIDFAGRIDNQVKLRGFRVELDEIEKVLCGYPSVRSGKVLVRSNGTEDYLAGFFTADTQVNLDDLTAFLKSHLTYYMVPAALMQLERMPLTPNGKIDKKAFPEIGRSAAKKAGRRAAKKSLEQRLCEIFASVLGLEEVYADDSFFELGGTSLTASKVTMVLMSEDIKVKYGDIFDHPTPESLSEFIERRDSAKKHVEQVVKTEAKGVTRPALQWNTPKYAREVKRESLGNVLLTGTTGFLGIHVLVELLCLEQGHIYCLVRKGSYGSPEIRLKTMLIYYFSNAFPEEMRDRITVIDADITDKELDRRLADVPFDTVINCAACVKHFSDSDILDRINVRGVENLIALCKKRDAKLVQVSTVSVPGIHTEESYERHVTMHENELFVIDDMDNKYGISKYQAELRMLDAIESGMRGKIVRVGNLMGRHSDGEFQVNLETNMFLSGIRGFAIMGKYPISHMTDPMKLSPVDCTARALVLLSGTNDKFTAFNADSRYGFDEMKIIDACNRNGISIVPEDDDVYYAEFNQRLGDGSVNDALNGLAAYDIKGAHAVETDNLFTTNILYRIGFSWPLVDDAYLDRAIYSVMTLDYFNMPDADDE